MWDDADQIAAAWFEKASRAYVEQHQGCPWCGNHHCVFRTCRPEREQYSCSECDFFSCHTFQKGYFFTPGQSVTSAAD
jgi:hypothetical protein